MAQVQLIDDLNFPQRQAGITQGSAIERLVYLPAIMAAIKR